MIFKSINMFKVNEILISINDLQYIYLGIEFLEIGICIILLY